jgi:hypothetical protein
MPLSTIFQLDCGCQFLLVKETRVPRENHRPVTSHWQSLSNKVVSNTPRHEGELNSQFCTIISYKN